MNESQVETNVYKAKAVWPTGNPWQTGWLTLDQAEKATHKFCFDWRQIGVQAKAVIFYRDGSIVATHE